MAITRDNLNRMQSTSWNLLGQYLNFATFLNLVTNESDVNPRKKRNIREIVVENGKFIDGSLFHKPMMKSSKKKKSI